MDVELVQKIDAVLQLCILQRNDVAELLTRADSRVRTLKLARELVVNGHVELARKLMTELMVKEVTRVKAES